MKQPDPFMVVFGQGDDAVTFTAPTEDKARRIACDLTNENGPLMVRLFKLIDHGVAGGVSWFGAPTPGPRKGKRGPRQRWSAAQIKEVLELSAEGISQREIGKLMGRTEQAISTVLWRNRYRKAAP